VKELVSVLDGSTFVLSDVQGDIDWSPDYPSGLFAGDTRFLSKWVLTIEGERLTPLSIDDLQYYESRFFLVPGEPTHYVDAKTSVIRHRIVGGGFEERLTVLNHRDEPAVLSLRMEVASDFANLFDARDGHSRTGQSTRTVEDGRLRLCHRRGRHVVETVVSSTEPAEVDEDGFTFRVHLDVHGQWSTTFHAACLMRGADGGDAGERPRGNLPERPDRRRELVRWMAAAPQLTADSDVLEDTYRRSLIDLAALQYFGIAPEEKVTATGLPWYMTVFGRHSLITGYQTLAFLPHLARNALWILALLQGGRLDDFRDEEPGKILHEIRYREPGGFEEQPRSLYYGAADTTPLFVILLDEYEQWTGDAETVRQFEFEARAALTWLDTYGDLMGDGYLWYERRSPKGLENQCWKDSPEAITYADGRLPTHPRATCELQGYKYDAKMRAARLAREFWNDPRYADRLVREAEALKVRFNRDFWIEEGGYYALALDGEGNQVDALASNMGHLLWSGILDEDRAEQVVRHLFGDRLFSGWGVRSLARGQGRYNPVGYHNGAVWPFDNSLIALGLRRYGFEEEAARLALTMFEACRYFDGRLPEAFAGYDRKLTRYPVQYPRACSPFCSSAGTPLALLQALLGLEPHEGHLTIVPAVPEQLGRIELVGVPGRWGRIDAFGHGRLRLAADE
jgi:glycogen debranching enzyme